MRLRPGQREVAEYMGGFLAVPAVPGAGKTTVLSWLAARLIGEGLPRGTKILVVTVMNSAAANFSRKIGDWLEERGLPRGVGFEVRTLHSLALQIIRQRPEAAMLRDDFAILDGAYRERLVEDIVLHWIDKNQERWQSVLKVGEGHRSFQQALDSWRGRTVDMGKAMLSQFKATGLTPEQILARVKVDNFFAWSAQWYQEYQIRLTQLGVLDFDDLLLRACRMVETDAELCARLAQGWPYIFEDEAQDSTPLQQRLLLALAALHGNLVRVGDSNQAILGTFTDSNPQLFRDFARRPDVRVLPMLQSNRSSRDIIALANGLVRWCQEHPVPACREALEPTYIEPVAPDDPFPNPSAPGYTLGVKAYEDLDEEILEVSRHAAGYIPNPDKTVVILAPTNWLVAEFREKLAEMEVPLYEISNYPAERRKTIDDPRAILSFLAQPGQRPVGGGGGELVPELGTSLPSAVTWRLRRWSTALRPGQLAESLEEYDLWLEVGPAWTNSNPGWRRDICRGYPGPEIARPGPAGSGAGPETGGGCKAAPEPVSQLALAPGGGRNSGHDQQPPGGRQYVLRPLGLQAPARGGQPGHRPQGQGPGMGHGVRGQRYQFPVSRTALG